MVEMLTKEQKQIIEENWEELNRYINYLWNAEFKALYHRVKLDYDDFLEISYVAMCECSKRYIADKAAFTTYVKNAVVRKGKKLVEEMNRDKRWAYTYARSFSEPVRAGDESVELGYTIACNEDDENTGNVISVCNYLSRLSTTQVKILLLAVMGYDRDEMKIGLLLTDRQIIDAYKSMQLIEKTILLKGAMI